LDAIRTVYRGQKYILPNNIALKLAERMGSQDLSDRELEVLGLMAKVMNNRQISNARNVVESTVRFHGNIFFGKLNVGDRTQAVVVAVNRGIVRM
jgi:two-component system NarL family response regulator